VEIRGIITHTRPHLDEITAIWLLRKFGGEKYPGVSTTEIIFWTEGGTTPDGRSAAEWEADGYLLVGTGGGKFDEHPNHNGSSGKSAKGKCAATLVAEDLGIEDDPALKIILESVEKEDLKGGSRSLDLPALVKLLHGQFLDQPEKVIQWAIMGLEAKYYEQVQFFQETKKEFDEKAKVIEIKSNGRTLKVAVIESGNEVMSKFARSSFGCEAAVVIQKHPSGNVQIFTNRKYGLKITDVAQMLRLEEQRLKGKLITTDWQALAAEGKVEGAEEWYFHTEGQMLLNGSLAAPGVTPTRISLERIVEIVTIGINSQNLPECCASNRICTFKKCAWYNFGLHRCRRIRSEMRKDKNA